MPIERSADDLARVQMAAAGEERLDRRLIQAQAEVERLRSARREALLTVGERVMTFGGFQRTPRGEFYVSRDDVIRLVDELLDA